MSCKITVLVENSAPDGLEAEHGLSLFVETSESAFIFDCGQSGMAWRNAERLGIHLSSARFAVISHSHYDHAGGFPSLLEYGKPEALYVGPHFWEEKYSRDDENDRYIYKGCGFKKEDLDSWGVEERVCEGLLPLDSCAQLFTGFEKHYAFERIPQKFVRGEAKAPDSFDDEICLLTKERDGLALVVGCSHQGILNITATVKERTGLPVRRIIGGIHLSNEGKERIDETLRELERLGVQTLNLCHCSGADVPGRISTGSIIEFE